MIAGAEGAEIAGGAELGDGIEVEGAAGFVEVVEVFEVFAFGDAVVVVFGIEAAPFVEAFLAFGGVAGLADHDDVFGDVLATAMAGKDVFDR